MKKICLLSILLLVCLMPACFLCSCSKTQCDHDYQEEEILFATCDSDGYTTYKCTKCGDSYTEEIMAIGHDYVEISRTEATCGSDGEIIYQCNNCGNLNSKTIPAAGIHDYQEEEILLATCDSDGYTTYKCTKCGDSYTEKEIATGHDYVETSRTEATCVSSGEIIYQCNNCGSSNSKIIPATGIHAYEETIRIDATCVEQGSVEYVCKACGDTYVDTFDPLEHKYGLSMQVDAQCLEDGKIIYTCERCGDSYEEIIPATGHNFELIDTIFPTCLDDGEEQFECSRCHRIKSDSIPATGHAYQMTYEKKPSCTDGGEYIYVCANINLRTNTPCLQTETKEVPALGHNWVITNEVAPTYDTAGYYNSECLRCAETKTDKINKLEYELAINYYYGYTDTFVNTRVRSQDTEGFYLGKTTYFNSALRTDPIVFDDSLLLQNYYTHSILSIKQPITANDKTYTVDSGFKIQFGFNFLDKVIPNEYSEFLSLFDDDAILKVVQKKESGYFTVYEVVDLSWSSIQVAKRENDGTFKVLDEIDTAQEWNAFLMGDMRLSDVNNKPFFDKGTYRIMVKSNVAWFLEAPSNGGIYNSTGEKCYPYGLINDQYDFFYVNVSGDTYNVLRPDELDESHDMFYQVRFSEAKTESAFIKSGDRVDVGDSFNLKIDTKLSFWDNIYHYGTLRLIAWNLTIAQYDVKTDTYITNYQYDLILNIDEDGSIFISLPNDYTVQGNCKITVTYTLVDPTSLEETTRADAYYLNIA